MRAALSIAAIVLASFVATGAAAGVVYAYDDLGRLHTASYDNGKQIVYTYDPAGNRTQVVTQAASPHAPLKISKKKAKTARHH
ncbi:MAG: RHS repeat domain-containing protein [bacterium]